MTPKIQKITNEIEKTKSKIKELEALLPKLEREKIELEDAEIIKQIRSANISPDKLPAFLESIKSPLVTTAKKQEDTKKDEE